VAEPIDLRQKVVAVFDTAEATDAAVRALRGAGHEVEVLRGEDGRRRLHADGENEGFLASLRKAMETILGDEDRIVDHVDEELAHDRTFVVVDSAEKDEGEIASLLKEHGGHYLWHFDTWTYVSLGGGAER
jgi:hypothetical protein